MQCPFLHPEARLRAAAYYEAGHAVAAIYLGYRVTFATVVADQNYEGYVTSSCQSGTEEHILVSLAGVICLQSFGIRSDEFGGSWQDTIDYIEALAKIIPDDGIEPLDRIDQQRDLIRKRLLAQTESIFRKDAVKRAVTVLATKLIEVRAMDGADVHRIVDPLLTIHQGASQNKIAQNEEHENEISASAVNRRTRTHDLGPRDC